MASSRSVVRGWKRAVSPSGMYHEFCRHYGFEYECCTWLDVMWLDEWKKTAHNEAAPSFCLAMCVGRLTTARTWHPIIQCCNERREAVLGFMFGLDNPSLHWRPMWFCIKILSINSALTCTNNPVISVSMIHVSSVSTMLCHCPNRLFSKRATRLPIPLQTGEHFPLSGRPALPFAHARGD